MPKTYVLKERVAAVGSAGRGQLVGKGIARFVRKNEPKMVEEFPLFLRCVGQTIY